MTETTNYKLKKPGYEDYVDIGALNENADVIDVELHKLSAGKTDAAKPSAAGNLAALTADGKLQDSGRKPGEKNGVATLDENGHIPGAQIPNSFLPLAGGTMSGPINMDSQRITNLPKPSDGSEPLRRDDGGSAATLALFGFGPDAVPDSVLQILAQAALYKTDPATGLYDVSDNLLLTLPGVQIETGSYTGTGTYGIDNPNNLTFDSPPKFVVVYARMNSNSHYVMELIFNPELGSVSGYSFMDSGGGHYYLFIDNVSWSNDKRTVSWYDQSDALTQANVSGFTYYYITFM